MAFVVIRGVCVNCQWVRGRRCRQLVFLTHCSEVVRCLFISNYEFSV